MEEAWSFTSKSLSECLKNIIDLDLQVQVRHALDLPLQWSVPTFDARWYINLYQKSSDMIPSVLELQSWTSTLRERCTKKSLRICRGI